MEQMITISVTRDTRTRMIASARQEIDSALSGVSPDFDFETDQIKLKTCVRDRDAVRLTYEILRGVRLSESG